MNDIQPASIHDSRRAEAAKRAHAKLEFYRHVLTYAVVMAALAAINLITSPGYLWFLWPAVGWGIGVVAHAANVFAFSDAMLERMTERELRRHR
ncbi:MAG TPA: 2TM domain-containing protein [Polyangiales bacterium]|nr:2TM domain-containing protein [Polyangiales bacterium]